MSLDCAQSILCIDELVDSNLAAVFHSLQYITSLLNKHYYSQTPIDGKFLRESLGFVHSALVQLEGQLKNILSECLRLGMMSFLATTFRLPGLYEHPCCRVLDKKLQLSYAAAKASCPDLQERIDDWLVLVCLMSTKNIDESHSNWASWKAIAVREQLWDETRRKLKQVMWIDAIHDDLGRTAFEALITRVRLPNVCEHDNSILL